MKSSKTQRPRQMDEREKLRKFRELDDAFSQALREMEGANMQATEHRQQQRQQEFETRLRALMQDFRQTDSNVDCLLRTMLELGHIA